MADEFCLKMPDFHVIFRDPLHAVNLRHGTNGFTSLPKEGVLRIFSPRKIRRLRPGLNPRTWVPKAIPDLLNPAFSLPWCRLPVPCLEQIYGISPNNILHSTSRLADGSSASGISSHYLIREAESQTISTWNNFHVVTSQ